MTDQHEKHLRDLITEARQLVNTLAGHSETAEGAFALAYRLGYEAGRDVGYGQAEHQMHQAWATLAADIRAMAGVPLHEQLAARRTEPGGPSWEDHLTRHGGEEYPGGPVPTW